MADIQRWTPLLTNKGTVQGYATPDGPYVTYADHVEALRQARLHEGWFSGYDVGHVEGYEQGQRDALAAVEKHAAEFLAEDDRVAHDVLMFVIATIRGEQA